MPKSKTYEEFVEKFKPKKTTDDCCTPPTIYEIVKQWPATNTGLTPPKLCGHFTLAAITKHFPTLTVRL